MVIPIVSGLVCERPGVTRMGWLVGYYTCACCLVSICGFLVFRIWYLDFVKAILICLIYGNPDRVWSCLREARGDQDGMVGCQSPSSLILVPPLLVAPMINDRTHQCFHIISDQTRNLNSSPKHKYPRLFTFCGKLKKN